MSTLHCNFRITDSELTIKVEDLDIDYDRRLSIQRELKSSDGAVAVDLSGAGTMSALYVHTSSPITLTMSDDSTVVVESDLFLTMGLDVVSMQNLDEEVDAVVKIYAYGSAS